MNLLSSLVLLGSLALTLGCPKPGAINIAPFGIASQSSDFTNESAAINAIDGNKDPTYYSKSCTHTNNLTAPWWKLDMQQLYKISNVIITFRGDCCQERQLGAKILIGNFDDNKNPVCDTVTDVTVNPSKHCCNGMVGRYVNIVINRPEYLTLCEVEVYGDPVTQSYACF